MKLTQITRLSKKMTTFHLLVVAIATATSVAGVVQWPPPGPETDWLSAAGHGVFTHYLDGLQNEFGINSQGRTTTWSDAVDEFDAEAYAASAAQANARYAAWPERLYVVVDGVVAYKGGPGPCGYVLDDVRTWLQRHAAAA
jgi:hypothetical protein